MTEGKVIRLMREHMESQFPKICAGCERCYATLRDFLEITQHQGEAIAHDLEAGNLMPLEPLGTVTHATCPCGATLTVSSDGMPLLRLWSLLSWGGVESKRRGMTPRALLNYLRDEICKLVLSTSAQPDT